MNTYKTIDIARIIGIHVNTVRLYEKCGLIPKPERLSNGYRVFTDLHIEQFRLARRPSRWKSSRMDFADRQLILLRSLLQAITEKTMELTRRYIAQIDIEKANAEEAIRIIHSILSGINERTVGMQRTYRRKEAADVLGVTIDTLRNWEMTACLPSGELKTDTGCTRRKTFSA